MGKRAVLLLAISMAAIPSAAGADAVVGAGNLGRQCYEAARRGPADGMAGIGVCTQALSDEAMPQRDRAGTLVNRGIVYLQSNDINRAIADFDAAIRIDPSLGEGYVNRGIALLRLGGADREAIATLSTALAHNPIRPELAYYMRGVAYELVGDPASAYADYNAALMARPGWQQAVNQLRRFNIERRAVGRG